MKRFALIAAALGGTMLAASAASAAPMTYNFEQDYAGGAKVTGSFTGEDLNLDGVIAASELTAFDAFWSGNMDAPSAESFGMDAMAAFLYDFSDYLTQVIVFGTDGADWVVDGYNMGVEDRDSNYAEAMGSVSVWLAEGDEPSLLAQDNGTPVPEPAALALFGLGLAGLGFARTRRSR